VKPSPLSERTAAIVTSKGRMFEFQVPEDDHITIPADLDTSQLFPLVVGTLGDFAAETVWAELLQPNPATALADLKFAARTLQAYVESQLALSINADLLLLASAAHYLADAPGNAVVTLRRLQTSDQPPEWGALESTLKLLLGAPWAAQSQTESPFGELETRALASLREFYSGEADFQAVATNLAALRNAAYRSGSARELLLADVIAAVAFRRVRQSARGLLPAYSALSSEQWESYFQKESSLKELWPSQQILGEAGIYRGLSAVIQMPTSAGKTKATELIVRASLLSERASVVVVVAPFRALCQEIADSLRNSFAREQITINQLSDALQPDYFSELKELFGDFDDETLTDLGVDRRSHLIVVTPEKLLYALRQSPEIAKRIGLLIYDEAHQFDSGARGVTFELLITALKRMISDQTQTVLVSAVVTNASAVADWLFSDPDRIVVDSRTQTERNLAFASWTDRLGRLNFSEGGASGGSYFVPRVIYAHKLSRRPRETADRFFPERDSPISIGLYLALRLLPNGGVALFCGDKRSVGSILAAGVDHFQRGLPLSSPRAASSEIEAVALEVLYRKHFGDRSYLTLAAQIGLFGHHGDMPHGLRLCLEAAMRGQLIPLLVCTSTLAQGVNLPIRYLIVTNIRQGNAQIRVRDFRNLMGRAGRAGIHGEGTVIFTDPRLFDLRHARREGWRWARVQTLISESADDPTGSSLLELVQPFTTADGSRYLEQLDPVEVVQRLLADKNAFIAWISGPQASWPEGFTNQSLAAQAAKKAETVAAIESFLMANRPDDEGTVLRDFAETLCTGTFAYALADEAGKQALIRAFAAVGNHIDDFVPKVLLQKRYGKSLLGVSDSIEIDEWVARNTLEFAGVKSSDELFDLLWPFLHKFLATSDIANLQPQDLAYDLAKHWISGASYELLTSVAAAGTLPFGQARRRRIVVDNLLSICEHEIGFELTLVLAAIRESIREEFSEFEEESTNLQQLTDLLQKRLRYGLPDSSSISFYELGFCDRVVAQELANRGIAKASNTYEARNLVKSNPDEYQAIVSTYPMYMAGVLARVLLS
jgi:POLQ-like helicase